MSSIIQEQLESDLSLVANMPRIAFGTWFGASSTLNKDQTKSAVKTAIQSGYRHIDCAALYKHQDAVGEAIQDCICDGIVTRKELWITFKLWCTHHRPTHVGMAIQHALQVLRLDYMDLLMIHWPFSFEYTGLEIDPPVPKKENGLPKFTNVSLIDTWAEMEKWVDNGIVRNLGVSNFGISELVQIVSTARIPPIVNQLQVNVQNSQSETIRYCTQLGVHVTAYSLFGSDTSRLLMLPLIQALSRKYNKTPAQILIRWALEKNLSVVVRTTDLAKMKENQAVFNFCLHSADVQTLDLLNKNEPTEYHDYSPLLISIQVSRFARLLNMQDLVHQSLSPSKGTPVLGAPSLAAMPTTGELPIMYAHECTRGGCGGTKTTLLSNDGWAVYIPNAVDGLWLRQEWPRIMSDEIYMQTILKALGIRTMVFEPCIVRKVSDRRRQEQQGTNSNPNTVCGVVPAPTYEDFPTFRTRSFEHMSVKDGEHVIDTKEWSTSPWIRKFNELRRVVYQKELSLLSADGGSGMEDVAVSTSMDERANQLCCQASVDMVFGSGTDMASVETTVAMWRPVCDSLWADVCRIAQSGICLGSDSWNVILVPSTTDSKTPNTNNMDSLGVNNVPGPTTSQMLPQHQHQAAHYHARFFAFDLTSKHFATPRRILVDENNVVHLPKNEDGTLRITMPEEKWKSYAANVFHHLVQDVVWAICVPVSTCSIPQHLQTLISAIVEEYVN